MSSKRSNSHASASFQNNAKVGKDKIKLATSTPKGRKNNKVGGRSNEITDRFIPHMTSGIAFRSAQGLKNLNFESRELSETVSPSPSHLSMPGFFRDLRSTRHYDSIVSNQLPASANNNELEVNGFQKLYRQYVADALGFHSENRVYQFSAAEVAFTSKWTSPHMKNSETYAPNHSLVDPLLSVLAPRQVLSYLVSQTFSKSLRTKSLVPATPRPKTRAKSHVPYRVLDAPSLRNDFYSNLISWSSKTGNIVVGLGCAVYLWSDARGAVNVLHYSYLQSRDDYVTCVSFSPFERYLVVGTKQGRVMLFDQIDDEEPVWDENKPICVGADKSIMGVCCLDWVERDYGTQLAVGGNDNSCTIWNITELEAVKLQFVLPHKAAVKAVAFCPWSKSLLATGGGSKDRNIRFWHTHSGTLLKEKKAPGQITSLIWSLRQKQIVATFGFGEVEKPTLVSVYSYPSMNPTVEVHSATALRVLSAVPSPDFGSICVATNDETVRFYELWNIKDCTIFEAQEKGIYGSDLIEYTEGIQKNHELIR
ncbi:LANO_0F16160g1_1 [Lachancea nothofagi CBS 11611]|uniref:LANO_0F16160g1_1 n=1 Tax=Lachancea nothofagi CBS 11611 TaxID=1266666 RepID=A0A1G4KCU9_9SACH|nr:LANO_0F16160g1_1 [Lachancea nothofagi CBS 11611]